jgi:hypothetical protein
MLKKKKKTIEEVQIYSERKGCVNELTCAVSECWCNLLWAVLESEERGLYNPNKNYWSHFAIKK